MVGFKRVEQEDPAGRPIQRSEVHPVEIGRDLLLRSADHRDEGGVADLGQVGRRLLRGQAHIGLGRYGADHDVGVDRLAVRQGHRVNPTLRPQQPGHRGLRPYVNARIRHEFRDSLTQDFGPVRARDVAEGGGAFAMMEPRAQPGAAHVLARQFELEPGQRFEERFAHPGPGPGIEKVDGALVLPVGPVALGESPGHHHDESGLVREGHGEGQKVERVRKVEEPLLHAEQHSNSPPLDLGQGSDEVEKEQQRPVAMQNVVVSEGIETTIPSRNWRRARRASARVRPR